MNQSLPNLLLFVSSSCFLMFLILFQNISPCCKFHHNTQGWRLLIIECLFVSNDILFVIGCQNTDLVESILTLLLFHGPNFYLPRAIYTFFKAYYLPSTFRFTLNTWPKAPYPSLEMTSKSLRLEVFPYIITIND